MPDDMLEDAISVAKKALEEHDFEEQGVEVRYFSIFVMCTSHNHLTSLIDCENREETHG